MRTVGSSFGYQETLDRVLELIAARGLTVFARFDHAAAAHDAGLELAPEVVVVFGSPRAGTPLMQEDPRIGIELPLRLLVWEREGETTLGYEDPHALASRYDVDERAATLDAMASLLEQLAREAAGEA